MQNRAIQGLRAVAIAMIVLTHCGILKHYGQIGDVLFFCLSGFFAVKPFEKQFIQFHYLGDVAKYYKRKIIKILPAYYIVLIVIWALTDDRILTSKKLLKALVFYECPSHLWFVQQIVWMYAVTPLILVFIHFIDKNLKVLLYAAEGDENNTLSVSLPRLELFNMCLLTVISIVTPHVLTTDVFYLLGNGAHQPFKIWQYMMGMSFGYLYKFFRNNDVVVKRPYGDAIAISILALSVVTSDPIVELFRPDITDFYKVYWSGRLDWIILILSGILILILAMDNKNIVTRMLGHKYFVGLGNISYETYLLHVYFLIVCRVSKNPINEFIFVYLITICVADQLHKIAGNSSLKFIFTHE